MPLARLALVLLALPFTTLHCANDPASAGTGDSYSCLTTRGQVRTCVRDDNLTSEQLIAAANRCVGDSASTATEVDACPADNQLGVCVGVKGIVTQKFIYYTDGGVTVDAAQVSCQSVSGTFSQ